MRKLLLTPIAIILPLSVSTCMVSCGDDKPTRGKDTFYADKMGHYVDESGVEYDYLYSNEINVERHKEYKCIINVGDFVGWTETDKISLWPNIEGGQPFTPSNVVSVCVDGKETVGEQGDPDFPWLGYYSDEKLGWAQISNWTFTSETKIEAIFTFDVPDKVNIWFTNRVME